MLVRSVQGHFRGEYECRILLLTPIFIGIQLSLDLLLNIILFLESSKTLVSMRRRLERQGLSHGGHEGEIIV